MVNDGYDDCSDGSDEFDEDEGMSCDNGDDNHDDDNHDDDNHDDDNHDDDDHDEEDWDDEQSELITLSLTVANNQTFEAPISDFEIRLLSCFDDARANCTIIVSASLTNLQGEVGNSMVQQIIAITM